MHIFLTTRLARAVILNASDVLLMEITIASLASISAMVIDVSKNVLKINTMIMECAVLVIQRVTDAQVQEII